MMPDMDSIISATIIMALGTAVMMITMFCIYKSVSWYYDLKEYREQLEDHDSTHKMLHKPSRHGWLWLIEPSLFGAAIFVLGVLDTASQL